MADETNIPTGIEGTDDSKKDTSLGIPPQTPDVHSSELTMRPANDPANLTIAGSFVMPTEPPALPAPPPEPQPTPRATSLDGLSEDSQEISLGVSPDTVLEAPQAPSATVSQPISQSASQAVSQAVLQAVSPPPLKPAIPEDETEYERIERLKVNTDNVPHSGAINDDIAKILKEVKLPERRNFKGAADPRTAPSVPIATTSQPAEKAATLEAGESKTPKERSIVTALHTLKDDVQDVVRNRNMSMVRASALEQDKKRTALPKSIPNPAIVQRRRRTFALIFFAILLLALGGAALYGVALVIQERATVPATQYPSLIFAESVVTLPIDNASSQSLKATIAQARAQSRAPLGSITRIVPTVSSINASGATVTTPATLQQFFTALGLQVPTQLMQGLGSTFFFGIHAVDTNAPVFVIPVTSYDLAFSGMLAWEPAMNQNLAPAFDAVPALVTGSDGLPATRTFTDAVMLNYDIRELKDDSGNVILYYSFPTPNLLIIAESPSSFSEILSRLEAQREL
jgi:hypothetical protein